MRCLIRWLLRDGDACQMSQAWLRQMERQSERVDYHSPRIALPVNKVQNERGWLNRLVLRQRRVA